MKLFIMEYWTNIRDKLTRTWTETQQFPSTVNSLFSTRLKHLFSNSASLFIPVCLFFSSLLLFPAFSSFFLLYIVILTVCSKMQCILTRSQRRKTRSPFKEISSGKGRRRRGKEEENTEWDGEWIPQMTCKYQKPVYVFKKVNSMSRQFECSRICRLFLRFHQIPCWK